MNKAYLLFLLSGLSTVPVFAQSISGTVFEDKNYGGGAGRSLLASSGVARPNATVELYDNAGNFLQSVTTNASGVYTFSGLAAGSFKVRVVNQSVTSARSGYTSTLFPVQTYRTDASVSGLVSPAADRVGGELPSEQDAAANTSSATLATLNAVASREVQSISDVTLPAAANITGVDFGFNFDLIVNTNDAGQGSYRMFLLNASNLGDEPALAQNGNTWNAIATVNAPRALPAGKESSIFMIADGNAHPGLRAGIPNLLSANGVAVINTSLSLYPLLAYSDAPNPDSTNIDGGTQTANVGNTNNVILGTGGTVGIGLDAVANTGDELTLSRLNGPEVEISGAAGQYPLQVFANNVSVRCMSIHGNSADIHLIGGSGYVIEQSVIGATAISFTPPAVLGGGSRALIYFDLSCTSAVVQNNLIGFSSQEELRFRFFNAPNIDLKAIGNEIAGNIPGTAGPGPGISLNDNYTASPNNASARGTVLIKGNLIRDCGPTGINSGVHYNLANANIFQTIVQENTLTRSSAGFQALFGSGNDLLVNNLIYDNRDMGVRVANRSTDPAVVTAKVKITKNSIYNNGTAVTANGLGIDLNEDGVTANTGVYTAAIPNLGMNYPVFTSVSLTGTTLTLNGFVGSAPGQAAFANTTVEVFKANMADANQKGEEIAGDGKSLEHGEGQVYLGSFTTGSSGSFSVTLNTTLIGATDYLTATATDTSGNTSEFGVSYQLPGIVLPVKITSFDAIKDNSNVLLRWSTAGEVNMRSYIIERLSAAGVYTAIGTVQAVGGNAAHSYTFTDAAPLNGTNFYRLRQVDNDGKYSYSEVRMVSMGSGSSLQIMVYPNPASDFITITRNSTDKPASIKVMNAAGKTVATRSMGSEASVRMDISSLPAGSYFVETINGIEKVVSPLIVR